MKTILVTGGAGFIGSNFARYMLDAYPGYRIINLDILTYAGNLESLKGVLENNNHVFIKGDIRDRVKVDEIFAEHDVDFVVNFAAESHVDRSIEDPEVFLTTNIIGTQVLLDAANKHWKINSGNKHCRRFKEGVKFVQVSTDEVYGTLGKTGSFVESMPLMPNSPYSASKAGADMVVRAYNKTYGLPVNITRSSNNYGPYQFPEKLIPLMINNCIHENLLPVYGDGLQVRDWLHVLDHCSAIATVIERGADGEVYNIGGNCEKVNLEVVKMIIGIMNKPESLIEFVADRPGHDRRYALDNNKIKGQLGWEPKYVFEQGLQETVNWYMENYDWVKNVVSGEYNSYYRRMCSKESQDD